MTQENRDRPLFLYIRDNNEPKRVLTIARNKKDNIITFSYCINKITTSINEGNKGNTY